MKWKNISGFTEQNKSVEQLPVFNKKQKIQSFNCKITFFGIILNTERFWDEINVISDSEIQKNVISDSEIQTSAKLTSCVPST
jgi:hypothetical protein